MHGKKIIAQDKCIRNDDGVRLNAIVLFIELKPNVTRKRKTGIYCRNYQKCILDHFNIEVFLCAIFIRKTAIFALRIIGLFGKIGVNKNF